MIGMIDISKTRIFLHARWRAGAGQIFFWHIVIPAFVLQDLWYNSLIDEEGKGDAMNNGKKKILAALSGTVIGVGAAFFLFFPQAAEQAETKLLPPLINLVESTLEKPVSYSPLLSWGKDTQAVMYEFELFASPGEKHLLFHTKKVFTNHYNPPLKRVAGRYLGRKEPLYWRVRSLGFDGEPVSGWSKSVPLYTDPSLPELDHPVPLVDYGKGKGQTLLYPVYSWAALNGAASYVVEVYRGREELVKAGKFAPAETLTTENSEVYDDKPRIGTFCWRVRAKDRNGDWLGEWSELKSFRTEPSKNFEYAVLGDSISHGGGHYSFSPADFEFSWLSYLDFDAVNLSQSGDLSRTTRDRFLKDVLPFHPKYLLVFTGTNSLRAGEDPQEVIDDLEAIKQMSLSHGIRPIFLTLPPINPQSILHVFQEGSAEDWQERFETVNDYIRGQAYIDTASAFVCPDGVLPVELALDGLHPDVDGKKIIGDCVNQQIRKARAEADAQLAAYETENR